MGIWSSCWVDISSVKGTDLSCRRGGTNFPSQVPSCRWPLCHGNHDPDDGHWLRRRDSVQVLQKDISRIEHLLFCLCSPGGRLGYCSILEKQTRRSEAMIIEENRTRNCVSPKKIRYTKLTAPKRSSRLILKMI